jgi:hypothetical protein
MPISESAVALRKSVCRPGNAGLYQFALLATHVRRCRGFVTPIQALDSTRIYNAIIPAQRWAP